MEEIKFVMPEPILDKKEENSLIILTDRYEKMLEPTKIKKAGQKMKGIIPTNALEKVGAIKGSLTEKELYIKCMEVVMEGFKFIEKTAAKYTLSRTSIIEKVNQIIPDNDISSIEEICFARGYDIAKILDRENNLNIGLALAEGGATGAFGFAGLPFNLVLSIFLYYRAVQSVAMYYGYDVKDDPAELEIASEVFMNSISPSQNNFNEMSSLIGKVMVLTETTAIKQTVKKGWQAMAERGGAALLIVQMRALANKSAQKALEKAGQKELEETVFQNVFEQVGKKLTQKAVGKSVPIIGGVIGALFDSAQMKKILDYANIFYNKRFILDKEMRINDIMRIEDNVIFYEDVEDAMESDTDKK